MVDPARKEHSPELFNAIALRYDRVNAVVSFGLNGSWKRRVGGHLPSAKGLRCLDLATGTGDVALDLLRYPRVSGVVGIDPAEGMLAVARRKAERRGLLSRAAFVSADAQRLPFSDGSFDVVTVAFGLRNMPHPIRALSEAWRVLRPSGRLMVLEFSRPPFPVFRQVHYFYVAHLLPGLGFLMTGDLPAYRYLHRTIMAFPEAGRLGRMISQTGFSLLAREDLLWGTAVLYAGEKKNL